MKPKLSYTIWFTQRTGSQLLCKALEGTGIAGKPNEWLLNLFERPPSDVGIQEQLWEMGNTANGVFGLKYGFNEPHFSRLIEVFRGFPVCPPGEQNRVRVWEYTFPNHHHIFMTRRNKVRLAVSWWKAAQTQEWHRRAGTVPRPTDLAHAYSFDAIESLFCQCVMREAGIQEFFSEGNIVPLTIVYEDFIQEYEKTVRTVLEFLELDTIGVEIPPPYFAQTADSVSEEWVQRFRQEHQKSWVYRGW
ncbi:MAG TPA: Stf0 family sulfotransferase [Anaerolineales bacterium]|nr:Stf0 family sulfotransferase [Anaerolineales bacterium]